MIGLLRFVGLMNAAVWFGAGVFFTIGAGPAAFSADMQELLGPRNYPYFSRAIGQLVTARYFDLQLACGIVALLHLLGEWLYFGRSPRRPWLALLLAMFFLSVLQGYGLQPRLKQWHRICHTPNARPELREAAARSLRIWGGVGQAANLLVLAGLGVYLWRVANPAEPARFVSTAKFRS